MKDLTAGDFQKEKQTESPTILTKEQEESQSNKKDSGKSKCACEEIGVHGMNKPCDLVPLNKRLHDLERSFLQGGSCTCEGLRWVGFHFPVQHPDFGRSVACLCARETETQSRKDILIKASRLLDKKTFSEYDLKLNPKCGTGYKTAQKWAQGNSTPTVLLYGQTGVGKTHLAVASGWVKVGLGESVLFYSSAELVRELQAGIKNGTLDKTINRAKSAQNLILDDLGREYSTDWTTAIFHEIIDYRYNNNNNLQTLITTNHSLTELETILGLPVVSRLTDFTASTVVIMDGEDVRNRKR